MRLSTSICVEMFETGRLQLLALVIFQSLLLVLTLHNQSLTYPTKIVVGISQRFSNVQYCIITTHKLNEILTNQ